MKTITLFLLLFVATTFAQMAQVETHEPTRTNYVEENGIFKASAEIFAHKVELKFYDNASDSVLSFGLTIQEHQQLSTRLLSYQNKDKDFYMMPIKRGTIYIRFVEKYGYVQAIVHINSDGIDYYFPTMNKSQYKRLLRG